MNGANFLTTISPHIRVEIRYATANNYVANPAQGSRHNRGAAVDVTLVDQRGRELPMPTGFDEFSDRAHRDFAGLPAEALRNRALLEEVMTRHGFDGLPTEWWHFDLRGWEKYELLDVPLR